MKNNWLVVIGFFSFLVFIALILTPLEKKHPVAPVKVQKKAIGKIAIVIDDWGYSLKNLALLEELKIPLTCAILPGLKNSGLVARKINSLGKEIILHLPMEPKEKYQLEKNTITLGNSPLEIREIIKQGLASIYYAQGISNHMGSAITADKKISQIVLTDIKKHNLYFLDSFVIANSVCPEIAKSIKLKFAQRDIFLDNQSDLEYIRLQLIKLKKIARQKGRAIGIGHDRKNTLLALKTIIDQFKAEGYEFVFVSEITN